MNEVGQDSWLVPLASSPGAVTLVCVPYAGARPGVFAPLAKVFGDVNVVAVQLPGHGQRIREPLLTSMADVVAGLAPAVTRAVQGKFVLFGHSMGAMVALALARELQASGFAEPDHFVASACRAPRDLWDTYRYDLPDDALVDSLIELGADAEPFAHPELRELMLPVLRADLQVVEEFDGAPATPLRCPITAVAGTGDTDAKPELMAGWERETDAGFRLKTITGGHFLLEERPDDIAAVVRDVLRG